MCEIVLVIRTSSARDVAAERLVSLAPGAVAPLIVRESDGAVMDGNTRIHILLERSYVVNGLPRTPFRP